MSLSSPLRVLSLLLLSIFLVQTFFTTGLASQFLNVARATPTVLTRSFNETLLGNGSNPALAQVSAKLGNFWVNIQYLFSKIVEGWKNFFLGTPPPSASPQSKVVVDPETMARLKSEIINELKLELGNGKSSSNIGAVVLPSSGDAKQDSILADDLRQAFSDQVKIKFAPDGQSGIITPVVGASGTVRDYLFVITPIKQVNP